MKSLNKALEEKIKEDGLNFVIVPNSIHLFYNDPVFVPDYKNNNWLILKHLCSLWLWPQAN